MPALGEDALMFEFRFGQIAARVFDNPPARDLNLEFALQPENDIEQIDRFRLQIGKQAAVKPDLAGVARQRFGNRLRPPADRRYRCPPC